MPKLSAGGILVCTGGIWVFALRTSHAPVKRVNVKAPADLSKGWGSQAVFAAGRERRRLRVGTASPTTGPFFNSQPLNPNFVMYGRAVLPHSISISEKSP